MSNRMIADNRFEAFLDDFYKLLTDHYDTDWGYAAWCLESEDTTADLIKLEVLIPCNLIERDWLKDRK